MDQWIVIPGWDRHQHYKDRDPTWIKVYTELNSSDVWLSCSCSARGLLVTCWLEYARSKGRLRRSHVARIAGAGFKQSYLDSLNQAGFIEFSASEPLALARARALGERREEKEKEPLTPPEVGKGFFAETAPKANPRAAGTNPRAVEKYQAAQSKEHAHTQLLDEARRIASTWNGGDSLHFDETLDELEHQHALKLGSLERDRLWEQAFQHRTPVEEDELF